jgi:hypothetical protein
MRKDSDRPPDKQPENGTQICALITGGDPLVENGNRGNADLQSSSKPGKFEKLLRSDPRLSLVVVVPGVSVV